MFLVKNLFTKLRCINPVRFMSTDKHHEFKSKYTTKLNINDPTKIDGIEIYQVLDINGEVVDKNEMFEINKELVLKMYKNMKFCHYFDQLMFEAQKAKKFKFYVPNIGQEGFQIGCAAALDKDDLLFLQYREVGICLWRGLTMDDLIGQCFGNINDVNKSRQLPVHYGKKESNVVTISSPLTTQLPQAVGAGYVYKRNHKPNCVVCFFGDGSASKGDAHSALNFASTLECPVLFIVCNNGFALSTPVSDQYRGDGIACRAAGYGMLNIRVDGNDALAVYNATKLVREICIDQQRPVLLEAMSYRVAPHATGDDDAMYRSKSDSKYWNSHNNPINRLKSFLIKKEYWDEDKDKAYIHEIKEAVSKKIEENVEKPFPNPMQLFDDVYNEMPPRLKKQMTQHYHFMKEHPECYYGNYEPISWTQ